MKSHLIFLVTILIILIFIIMINFIDKITDSKYCKKVSAKINRYTCDKFLNNCNLILSYNYLGKKYTVSTLQPYNTYNKLDYKEGSFLTIYINPYEPGDISLSYKNPFYKKFLSFFAFFTLIFVIFISRFKRDNGFISF